jgi:hypothetical protein
MYVVVVVVLLIKQVLCNDCIYYFTGPAHMVQIVVMVEGIHYVFILITSVFGGRALPPPPPPPLTEGLLL